MRKLWLHYALGILNEYSPHTFKANRIWPKDYAHVERSIWLVDISQITEYINQIVDRKWVS